MRPQFRCRECGRFHLPGSPLCEPPQSLEEILRREARRAELRPSKTWLKGEEP